jgi:cysteine-rich repeat protein
LPAASLRWSGWDAANSRLLLCTAANADCPDGARYYTALRRGDDAGPNLSTAQPHEAPFTAANWLAPSDVANGSGWPARCGSGSCNSPLTDALLAQVPIFSSAKTYAGRAGFLAHVVGSDRLGWIAPLISASACGDGQRGPGEDCDDGNHDPFDGCDTSCQTPVCGDGILAPSEACDDGGQVAGDGCDAACVLEGSQPGERWQYGALLGFVPLEGGTITRIGNVDLSAELTAFAMQRTEAIDANASLTPQDQQNWFQARRQCRLMGADLASEAQWQWAAQSLNNNWLWGWGNAGPGCTAAAGVHVVNTVGCFGAVRPACSMPSGRSAQGICELAGNADMEWVLDGLNGPGPVAADINPVHRLSAYDSAYRRGGSFSNIRFFARANDRNGSSPRADAASGFRCVWSVVAPEP